MNAIVENRTPEEIAAAQAASNAARGEFTQSASDFSNKFVEALNPSLLETGVMAAHVAMSDKEGAARYLIARREPNQVLDAIAEADPRMKELMEVFKADPKLAEAFHGALHKDETTIPGLQKMMANGASGDGMSIDDLTNSLKGDGLMAQNARGQLTQALTHVANDPKVGFEHIEQLGSQAKRMKAALDFDLMLNNPDQYTKNLLDSFTDMDPQIKEMLAGLMHHIMPLVAAVVHPNGFMLQDVTAFANKYNLTNPGKLAEGFRETGRQVLDGDSPAATETRADAGGTPDAAARDIAADNDNQYGPRIANADNDNAARAQQDDLSAQGNTPGFMHGPLRGTEVSVDLNGSNGNFSLSGGFQNPSFGVGMGGQDLGARIGFGNNIDMGIADEMLAARTRQQFGMGLN